MPVGIETEKLGRDLHLQVECEHLAPLFFDDVGEGDLLDLAGAETFRDALDDLSLRRAFTLVHCNEVLLFDQGGWLRGEVLDEAGQVFDVNGGQVVVARVDHWERSQVWMQREPRSPEEFIEDVVGLTMAVRQATADHTNLDVLVELLRGHSQIL